MSERAALVEYLRMEFDRDNDSRDSKAADLLERDGDELARLADKALRFDLDAAGIASRERDAVELVELRAKLAMAKSASKKYVYSTNGVIDRAEARIAELEAERGETRKENEWLRAYTGQSAKACVYCGLGADEQAQCERGFPGCARGDDQMLCPEVGVAIERDEARAALAETRRELLAARKVIASSRVVVEWAEPVTDGDWTEYDAAQRDLREYDATTREG